jgi:hypothetical protein
MRRRTLLGALVGVTGLAGCSSQGSRSTTEGDTDLDPESTSSRTRHPRNSPTETPEQRAEPVGCPAGSACELDGTLSLDGATVTLRNVHRRIGYAYRTYPDAAAVRIPPDRQFVILRVDASEGSQTGDPAALPSPDDFELVAGDRTLGTTTAGWESRPRQMVSPSGSREYDPADRRRGWVGLGLPKPFGGTKLAVSVEGADDVVPLPPTLVEGLRDPPAFELVEWQVPDAVEPYGTIAVEAVVENVGGSDGVCPVVVNHDSPYAFEARSVALQAGGRGRDRLAVTNAPGEEGAVVRVSLHAGGERREETVTVAEE